MIQYKNMNPFTFKIFFLCEDALSLNRAIALKEKLVKNCLDQEVVIEAHFCEYARLCHPPPRGRPLTRRRPLKPR